MTKHLYLGSTLKRLRNQKGVTQTQVAKDLHISGPLYNNWENNKHKPSPESLAKLSNYYQVQLGPKGTEHYQKNNNYINMNLNPILKAQHLKITDLSKNTHIPVSTIYNIHRSTHLKTLRRVIAYFEISADSLVNHNITDNQAISDNLKSNLSRLAQHQNKTFDSLERDMHLAANSIIGMINARPIANVYQIAHSLNIPVDTLINPHVEPKTTIHRTNNYDAATKENQHTVETFVKQLDINKRPIIKRFIIELQHQGLPLNSFLATLKWSKMKLVNVLSNNMSLRILKQLAKELHVSLSTLLSPQFDLLAYLTQHQISEATIINKLGIKISDLTTGLLHRPSFKDLQHCVTNAQLNFDKVIFGDQWETIIQPTKPSQTANQSVSNDTNPHNSQLATHGIHDTATHQLSLTDEPIPYHLQQLFDNIKQLSAEQILILQDLINSWQK